MRESGNQEIRNLKMDDAALAELRLYFPDFLISRLKFLVLFPLFLIVALLSPARAEQRSDPDSTLVVFNTRDADSPALAKYYADRRKIPAENIVGLDCPVTEEITRDEYDRDIATPLRDILTQRNLWKTHTDSTGRTIVDDNNIRFVALIRGIPLKIARTDKPYEGDKDP